MSRERERAAAVLTELARAIEFVTAGKGKSASFELMQADDGGIATTWVFVIHPAIKPAIDDAVLHESPHWASSVAELMNREIARENESCEAIVRLLSESTDLTGKEKGLLLSTADLIAGRRQ